MEPHDPEDLLWELSRLAEAPRDPAGMPPDDLLRAFREGRLSEAETERVAALLARSPAARSRLRELAGLAAAGAPPAGLRERILAGFGTREVRPRPRRLSRWLPAVAALAAGLLIAVWTLRSPAGLPSRLAYDVTVRGLASERSTGPREEPAAGIRAYPDTPVRLEVSPRGAAEAEVDFGLYRVLEGRLERIVPGPALGVESERGAVRFRGLARDLVGSRPGARVLYLVAAREGDLPEGRLLEPEEDPRRVLAGEGGRRLVYPQTLRILPHTPEEGRDRE